MATVYRCDRCQKEKMVKSGMIRWENDGGFGWYDLCADCCHELKKWITTR